MALQQECQGIAMALLAMAVRSLKAELNISTVSSSRHACDTSLSYPRRYRFHVNLGSEEIGQDDVDILYTKELEETN